MASEPLLLGVRHHGPWSARAVRRALAAFQPEVVLIEGPPEADALVQYAGEEDMRAPVALLAYPADNPDPKLRASFWPLAAVWSRLATKRPSHPSVHVRPRQVLFPGGTDLRASGAYQMRAPGSRNTSSPARRSCDELA